MKQSEDIIDAYMMIYIIFKVAFTNDVQNKLMKYIEYEKNSENVVIKGSVEWQKFHSFLIKDVISHQRWFYKTDDSFVNVLQRIVSRKNKFDFSLYFWVICTTFHHYMMLVKYVFTICLHYALSFKKANQLCGCIYTYNKIDMSILVLTSSSDYV